MTLDEALLDMKDHLGWADPIWSLRKACETVLVEVQHLEAKIKQLTVERDHYKNIRNKKMNGSFNRVGNCFDEWEKETQREEAVQNALDRWDTLAQQMRWDWRGCLNKYISNSRQSIGIKVYLSLDDINMLQTLIDVLDLTQEIDE